MWYLLLGQLNFPFTEHLFWIIFQTCFVSRSLCNSRTISLSVFILQHCQPKRGRYTMQMMTWGLENLISKNTTCKLWWVEIPLICMSVGFRLRWSDLAKINHCVMVEHPSLTCRTRMARLWAGLCRVRPLLWPCSYATDRQKHTGRKPALWFLARIKACVCMTQSICAAR